MSTITYLPDGTVTALLDSHDVALGNNIGRIRYNSSRDMNLKGKAGAHPTEEMDVNNRKAMIGLHRILGLAPNLSINEFDPTDSPRIIVRTTTLSRGRLIIRPNDRDNDILVLSVGQDHDWRYVGFLTVAEAKEVAVRYSDKFRPDCWMVTQDKLRPMTELKSNNNA